MFIGDTCKNSLEAIRKEVEARGLSDQIKADENSERKPKTPPPLPGAASCFIDNSGGLQN